MSQALEGVKVLDLAWVVAGPTIGRALADFGATVIRVESSRRVETARHMQPFYKGVPGPENSALYGNCNAGKLDLSLDLSKPEARAVVMDLARWADLVVEAFAPGQLARWGLDYENLRQGRSDLVMLSTSLNGQTGPYAKLAGFGNIGSALSGFQSVAGYPDLPPLGPFGPYTDYVGPRFSIVALLAALDERERTGRGCYIDLSQSEAGAMLLSPELLDVFLTDTVFERPGNRDRVMSPHGVYECRPEGDTRRYVAVAVRSDEDFARLAEVLGRPELATDPRYSSPEARLAAADELDDLVNGWTQGHTAEEVEGLLQAVGVPAHVSQNSEDFVNDPQLRHRGHLVHLEHPIHGDVVVEGPRYQLSGTPAQVTRAAPTIGQDNAYVLREILGYDDERLQELAAADALV